MLDRSRCVVIVPLYHHIETRCERGLRDLERAGYAVWRRFGGAAIDLGRNRLAQEALTEGYHELMWIDSDIEFPVDAVDHLRDQDVPLIGCAYPKKGEASFAFHSGPIDLTMGPNGKVVEVTYLPTGFLFTRREVYERIISVCQLPLCNRIFADQPFYPFFLPMIVPHGTESWYLPEDYAFCHRARQAGYPILLDTRIRLMHLGVYGYSWEDACGPRPRVDQLDIALDGGDAARARG